MCRKAVRRFEMAIAGIHVSFMRGMALAAWMIAVCGAKAATFEELARDAAAARRGNHVEEAIALYRQALDANASWPEGWWFLGTLSYSSYHYTECEEAFGHFVKLDGKRNLGWALLGLCEFETGKFDHALDHLQQGSAPGSELPPEVDAAVRFHDGLLLTRAGLFDRGRRELQRFAQGCDKEQMLLIGIGLNALHQPLLPKDVPAERQDLVAKAGKAACAWMLGLQGNAEDGFRALIASYPAAQGAHYLYGTYLGALRPEDAKAEFQREIELNPANADAHAMLALMLLNAGDASGALAQAKKAAPPDALTEYAYGEALIRTGAVQPAIERLETAVRLDSGALEYHMALAGAYSRAGRNDDARRERRAALEMATGQHGSD
jgi:tetratricopeptide (TPR) repeat protein